MPPLLFHPVDVDRSYFATVRVDIIHSAWKRLSSHMRLMSDPTIMKRTALVVLIYWDRNIVVFVGFQFQQFIDGSFSPYHLFILSLDFISLLCNFSIHSFSRLPSIGRCFSRRIYELSKSLNQCCLITFSLFFKVFSFAMATVQSEKFFLPWRPFFFYLVENVA